MPKQRRADRPDEARAGTRSRRRFLKAAGGAGAVALTGCAGDGGASDSPTETRSDARAGTATGTPTSTPMADSVTIFHAGSLEAPFGAAESRFEEKFGVEVNREAKGSVASTKKITRLGRRADVLGVSDFRLIRNRVLPEFGDWYAIFATNSMSIQYHEDSTGANDVTRDEWWEVLSRDGVTIGHSDPAIDPGGYRAVMTQQLGSVPFEGSKLYGQSTYQALRRNSIVPTGTETNLEGQLRAGKLDYAVYYQSISSTAGLPYIDLKPQVDLSKATSKYAQHYAKAEVETDSGTFTGAPIAYGITVPSVARAPRLGAKWIEFVIAGEGRRILAKKGLSPVRPAVVPESGKDAVPSNVMAHASPKSKLGPMDL